MSTYLDIDLCMSVCTDTHRHVYRHMRRLVYGLVYRHVFQKCVSCERAYLLGARCAELQRKLLRARPPPAWIDDHCSFFSHLWCFLVVFFVFFVFDRGVPWSNQRNNWPTYLGKGSSWINDTLPIHFSCCSLKQAMAQLSYRW